MRGVLENAFQDAVHYNFHLTTLSGMTLIHVL